MYEGLGVRLTKERKKFSPTAIVIIVFAGVLVASVIGYLVFWYVTVDSVFGKFYGVDTGSSFLTARSSPTGYAVLITKPGPGSYIGTVTIRTVDTIDNLDDGKISMWFSVDALTNDITGWAVGIALEPKVTENFYMYRTMGLKLDRDWKSYPEDSGLVEGKTQPYTDKYRAEIQKMFNDVYSRWGYEFPTESVEPYDFLVQQEW